MIISPIKNHRTREKGNLVYPVYSRRSGGLSIGVNLFPDQKCCSFDCPYCEVFPFKTGFSFCLEDMKSCLIDAINDAKEGAVPIKDISFSGNGEPCLSPHFPDALKTAVSIRDEKAPEAAVVVITNGTGLLTEETFELLRENSVHIDIWLKLDAGTPDWYRLIDRSAIDFETLIAKIKEFVSAAPVTLQTMLCKIDGMLPSDGEVSAWEGTVSALARTGNVKNIHLYGKARPAPEDPLAETLPMVYLENRAASLRKVLEAEGIKTAVSVF